MSQTFVITGASRGLGLEFVKQLSAKGHTVLATARKPNESQALSALIDNKRVFSVVLDTTDTKSVETAFERIKEIAPSGIDVLINNAGIYGPVGLTALNTNGEAYLKVFNTNIVGTSNVTQAALPLLRKKDTRSIVNISADLGSIQLNIYGDKVPAYCTSEAALNCLTKAYSVALKDEKFIVAAIDPGWVQTDMGGKDAVLKPDESIAGLIAQIEKLNVEKTGSFFNYRGEILPY